jgi:hypothetical protein
MVSRKKVTDAFKAAAEALGVRGKERGDLTFETPSFHDYATVLAGHRHVSLYI